MAAVIGLTSYLLPCHSNFNFFFQTRRLPTEVLNLGTYDPSRRVLHCASERGSFILLELAAMMLSTPPQAQTAREGQRDLSAFILRFQKYVQYKHEYM